MNHKATRHNGMCRGLLSLTYTPKNTNLAPISYYNVPCTLIGNFFKLYDHHPSTSSHPSDTRTSSSFSPSIRFPTLQVRIVGSSAWSGHSITGNTNLANECRFRILTYTGSQLVCTCKTPRDCQVWLAALHSGLEASYCYANTDVSALDTILTPPAPPKVASTPYCHSCGTTDRQLLHPLLQCPLPQYNRELQVRVCRTCWKSQGVLGDLMDAIGMYRGYEHEVQALELARELCVGVVGGCMEEENDDDPDDDDPPNTNKDPPNTNKDDPPNHEIHHHPTEEPPSSSPSSHSSTSSWEHIPHSTPSTPNTPRILHELHQLTSTPGFMTLRRRSRRLEIECRRLAQGTIFSHDEFLELITVGSNGGSNARNQVLLQQSLRLSDDFTSLLNLLKDYCWGCAVRDNSCDLVRGLLNYLLERVNSPSDKFRKVVAFYLPHLLQIYLGVVQGSLGHSQNHSWDTYCRTLDATIIRDLLEEFLITLAARDVTTGCSITWTLLAEGDRDYNNLYPPIRRLLLTLESLIFQFDDWYGGGSVIFPEDNPCPRTPHQDLLMHRAMQEHHRVRLACSWTLPYSYRYKKEAGIHSQAAVYRANIHFQRQLTSIAEELYRVPVGQQMKCLEKRLKGVNKKGGALGVGLQGADGGLWEVWQCVEGEGHVFRSKARTPVLLLLEVMRSIDSLLEEKEKEDDDGSSHNDDGNNDDGSSSSSQHTTTSMEHLVNSCLLQSPMEQGILSSSSSHNHTPNDDHEDDTPTAARRRVLHTLLMDNEGGYGYEKQSVTASIQKLDRKRAQELLAGNPNHDNSNNNSNNNQKDHHPMEQSAVILDAASAGTASKPQPHSNNTNPEDEEAMEALRLLLLNGVHQHGITCTTAFDSKETNDDHNNSNTPIQHKDAGYIDPRLAGCGPLSSATHRALELYQEGVIRGTELLELVKSDQAYMYRVIHVNVREEGVDGDVQVQEGYGDASFWVRFAFGERWAEKRARIAAGSVLAHECSQNSPSHIHKNNSNEQEEQEPIKRKEWDLQGIIVKANDDLRQEAFIMQLIQLCEEAWRDAGLKDMLWVQPYTILPTGKDCGIIETVKNALSFDALKKRDATGGGSSVRLLQHFERMAKYAADPETALQESKYNFIHSLAAYSLICHLFQVKDRHNGNILLDTAGHVIHIDFGFVFGIAPGGTFSLEGGVPFKLTEEMVEVMGGVGSELFSEFITSFCCGFLALQRHADTFLTLIEITYKSVGQSMPCFEYNYSQERCKEILEATRQLFRMDLYLPVHQKEDRRSVGGANDAHILTVRYAVDLIKKSMASYGTSQYDYFQYITQGIAP